jgi:Ca2+ transporting ATPase
MVTGDNIVTARAIAINCNILTKDQLEDTRCCMEGPEFYEKMGGIVVRNGKEEVGNFKVFKEMMPYMKVMARSRPEDKYLMVTGLRQMGCTVAVTGDGTNDAPALKKADVGFAMGKTGTDVCKEAADILITDDNFSSIVKACMWGRNVFDNIKRFLQFQLTVNVGACIITFIGAIIGKESPLQPIQLLWVNLIMDSLASLALATEMPKPELLLRMPQNREDYIVSRKMIKHILGQALWQCSVLFTFLFAGEYLIPESVPKYEYPKRPGFVFPGRADDWDGTELYTKEKYYELGASRHLTFIFNSFVFMQIFNMFNARKIHDEWNVFEGIHKNFIFIGIWCIIVAGQGLICQLGSIVFVVSPDGLDGPQWGICLLIGSSSLVTNLVLKCIPDWLCPKIGQDSVDDRRKEAAAQKRNQVK